MCSIVLLELCLVSTSIGELVVANKVYQNYPILISHKVIPLVLLNMIWLISISFLVWIVTFFICFY